jgi:hypothetical protein
VEHLHRPGHRFLGLLAISVLAISFDIVAGSDALVIRLMPLRSSSRSSAGRIRGVPGKAKPAVYDGLATDLKGSTCTSTTT